MNKNTFERDREKSNSLEIRREKWLRQLMADPKIEHGSLKVALACGVASSERAW